MRERENKVQSILIYFLPCPQRPSPSPSFLTWAPSASCASLNSPFPVSEPPAHVCRVRIPHPCSLLLMPSTGQLLSGGRNFKGVLHLSPVLGVGLLFPHTNKWGVYTMNLDLILYTLVTASDSTGCGLSHMGLPPPPPTSHSRLPTSDASCKPRSSAVLLTDCKSEVPDPPP